MAEGSKVEGAKKSLTPAAILGENPAAGNYLVTGTI
jgi:hypothetical protein